MGGGGLGRLKNREKREWNGMELGVGYVTCNAAVGSAPRNKLLELLLLLLLFCSKGLLAMSMMTQGIWDAILR